MDNTKPADASGGDEPFLDDDLDDLFADAIDHDALHPDPASPMPEPNLPPPPRARLPEPPATGAPAPKDVDPAPKTAPSAASAPVEPTVATSDPAVVTSDPDAEHDGDGGDADGDGSDPLADSAGTSPGPKTLSADAPRSAAAAELFSAPPVTPGGAGPTEDAWDAEDSLLSWRLIAVVVAVLVLVGFGAYKIFGGKTTDSTAKVAATDVDISATFATASPGSLPPADTGQNWEIPTGGTWATQGGHAMVVTPNKTGGNKTLALIDLQSASGAVTVDVGKIAAGWGIVFRYKSPLNYWMIQAAPKFSSYNLVKVEGGKASSIGSTGVSKFDPGTSVGVTFVGNNVTILVNGTPAFTSKNAPGGGTKVGLILADPGGTASQWGPFTAKKLTAKDTPPTAPPSAGTRTAGTAKPGGTGTTTAAPEAGGDESTTVPATDTTAPAAVKKNP